MQMAFSVTKEITTFKLFMHLAVSQPYQYRLRSSPNRFDRPFQKNPMNDNVWLIGYLEISQITKV
jgi:hypothetical protein